MRRIPNLHNKIAETVNRPKFVIKGLHGERIAVRNIGPTPFGSKHLIVPYDEGGEVRTAFITSDMDRLLKREILWRQQ